MTGFTNQGTASTGGGFSLPVSTGSGDFASMLTAAAGQFGKIGNAGTLDGNELASAAGGLAFGAAGAAFGLPPELTGKIGTYIGGLFGGKKTDETKQSADINTVAAANGVTGAEAAAVIANHANHSTDRFNDLAASVATFDAARFPSLLAEYNQANPSAPIQAGSVRREAEQTAQAQQKMITTALTTANFTNTALGQQFVGSLQQLPAQQVVGTQGQTIGEILEKILGGAQKGAADAAAETAWGKKFKWSYIKDWLKENQLLAFFLAIIAGLGLLTVVNIGRGKHGKISL